MKKVCIVVNALVFGGVEKVIENYLDEFDKNEFEITIIAQDNSNEKHIEYFKNKGFKVEIIGHKKNFLKHYIEFDNILKKNKFDIIHCNTSYTNFYALRCAKKHNIPVRINHYHNVFKSNWIKQIVYYICNRMGDKYATLNIFCSEAVKEYFGKCNKPSIILRNAIYLSKFNYNEAYRNQIRNELQINKDTVVLGHIGRFTKQKNHQFILKVFKKYLRLNNNSKLLLCGNGPLFNKIKKDAVRMKIFDKVIFLGTVSNPEAYYNAMDIFLFPSIFEGLGIGVLEAQVNSLYCISSKAIPSEVVLSDSCKKIELNIKKWVNELQRINVNRSSIAFDKWDIYSLEKHKNDLIDLYKKI